MPDGTGRPRRAETQLRTRELLRMLAAGCQLHEAAVTAGVKPARVLRLMSDSQFRGALVALLEQQERRAA